MIFNDLYMLAIASVTVARQKSMIQELLAGQRRICILTLPEIPAHCRNR